MHIKQVINGDNRWWKYLIGILAIFTGVLLGEIPIRTYSYYKKGILGVSDEQFGQYLESMNYAGLGISENMLFFLLLLSFLFIFGILTFVLPKIHKRPALSFITGRRRFDKKRFLTGLTIWMSFACLFTFLILDSEHYEYNFQLSTFIPLVMVKE